MTHKEADELLSDIISSYAPGLGRGMVKKTALKLVSSGVERKIPNINGDVYALAKDTLCKCGTILEEYDTDKIIFGLIFAGAANMNPAFIALRIERDTISIKAAAKEGLIKQHTAEQAVKIFESALDTSG